MSDPLELVEKLLQDEEHPADVWKDACRGLLAYCKAREDMARDALRAICYERAEDTEFPELALCLKAVGMYKRLIGKEGGK